MDVVSDPGIYQRSVHTSNYMEGGVMQRAVALRVGVPELPYRGPP